MAREQWLRLTWRRCITGSIVELIEAIEPLSRPTFQVLKSSKKEIQGLQVDWWWMQISMFVTDGKIGESAKPDFWIRFYNLNNQMNNTKSFILSNLLKMRDKHWVVDTEAVANLVEAFRDELRRIFDLLPEFASIERDEKEKRFEKWARNQILSITIA